MMRAEWPEAFTVAEWEDSSAASGGFNANFLHWRKPYYDLWFRDRDSYFLSAGRGDITKFLGLYLSEREKSLGKNYIQLTVGNHDLPRVARYGRTKTDLELINVFAFTMPNLPFIYYGDEIGMRQLGWNTGKEGCYGTRAGGRTPMQWSKGPNLGFSSGAPDSLWLPVDPAADAPTVAGEAADPDSMLNFMKTLIAFRKAHPALAANAGFYPVYAQPQQYPFAFLRVGGGETLLVIINPSAASATATIKGTLKGGKTLILGSDAKLLEKDGATSLTIPGQSYAVYQVK
jgi:maltose alpha-D-glucosyltransferase/alpha-amylase